MKRLSVRINVGDIRVRRAFGCDCRTRVAPAKKGGAYNRQAFKRFDKES